MVAGLASSPHGARLTRVTDLVFAKSSRFKPDGFWVVFFFGGGDYGSRRVQSARTLRFTRAAASARWSQELHEFQAIVMCKEY
jgi:hypothetical protein